jgi:hypothetical protein
MFTEEEYIKIERLRDDISLLKTKQDVVAFFKFWIKSDSATNSIIDDEIDGEAFQTFIGIHKTRDNAIEFVNALYDTFSLKKGEALKMYKVLNSFNY